MESTHTHGTGFLGRATAALLPAESLSKWLSAAGMSVFMLMVFLTFVDVFLRYWFGIFTTLIIDNDLNDDSIAGNQFTRKNILS